MIGRLTKQQSDDIQKLVDQLVDLELLSYSLNDASRNEKARVARLVLEANKRLRDFLYSITAVEVSSETK